ncbi:MAG: hypothetical protein ACMXYG_07295 [Candidatus Woesearchaeota archaeon]
MINEILFYTVGIIAIYLFYLGVKNIINEGKCASCYSKGSCQVKTKEIINKNKKIIRKL